MAMHRPFMLAETRLDYLEGCYCDGKDLRQHTTLRPL